MEHFKVAGAFVANAVLAVFNAAAGSPVLQMLLTLGQIGVAAVTILYIGTKVWLMWRGKRKDEDQ